MLSGDGGSTCSRYNGAYPVLLNNLGFGAMPNFHFLACTGDKSENVKDQVKKLADNSQDLVTISAGGNDALLTAVLKNCVYTPAGQENCDKALANT